jgi:hypothetical protein
MPQSALLEQEHRNVRGEPGIELNSLNRKGNGCGFKNHIINLHVSRYRTLRLH